MAWKVKFKDELAHAVGHKYTSKHKGSNGDWIYEYERDQLIDKYGTDDWNVMNKRIIAEKNMNRNAGAPIGDARGYQSDKQRAANNAAALKNTAKGLSTIAKSAWENTTNEAARRRSAAVEDGYTRNRGAVIGDNRGYQADQAKSRSQSQADRINAQQQSYRDAYDRAQSIKNNASRNSGAPIGDNRGYQADQAKKKAKQSAKEYGESLAKNVASDMASSIAKKVRDVNGNKNRPTYSNGIPGNATQPVNNDSRRKAMAEDYRQARTITDPYNATAATNYMDYLRRYKNASSESKRNGFERKGLSILSKGTNGKSKRR